MKSLWPLGLLFLAACTEGPAPRDYAHPPAIANLTFSTPLAVVVGYGGGTTTLVGSFDFTDVGRDVDRGVFEVLDGSGHVLGSTLFAIPGAMGMTSGTVQVQGLVNTGAVGSYPFQLRAKDSKGSVSNPLPCVFVVTAAGTPAPVTVAPAPVGLDLQAVEARTGPPR